MRSFGKISQPELWEQVCQECHANFHVQLNGPGSPVGIDSVGPVLCGPDTCKI